MKLCSQNPNRVIFVSISIQKQHAIVHCFEQYQSNIRNSQEIPMVEIASYGSALIGEIMNFSKNSIVIQMPQEDESGTVHTQNDSLQFSLLFHTKRITLHEIQRFKIRAEHYRSTRHAMCIKRQQVIKTAGMLYMSDRVEWLITFCQFHKNAANHR
jgi:hypothetical protein